MDDILLHGNHYVLGPRAPSTLLHEREMMIPGTTTIGSNIPSRVIAARDSTTTACTDPNLCEKPAAAQSLTVPITLGVLIPLVAAFSVLFYLHRRNIRKVKDEDARDPHKSLDFGFGEATGRGGKEKDSRTQYNRQMSMDMNLSSPYLLPPGMQSSRESLNSLARTLHQNEDPYRPIVKEFGGSDTASLRSLPHNGRDGASLYNGSVRGGRNSQAFAPSVTGIAPPRQNSVNRSVSPLPVPEAAYMKPSNTPGTPNSAYSNPFAGGTGPNTPVIGSAPYAENDSMPHVPELHEPLAAEHKIARKPAAPHQDEPSPADSGVAMGYGHESFEMMPQRTRTPSAEGGIGLGLGMNPLAEPQYAEIHTMSPPHSHVGLASGSPPPEFQLPILEEPSEHYEDYEYAQMPAEPRHPSDPHGQYPDDGHHYEEEEREERGRNMQRQSHLYAQDGAQDAAHGGLSAPQQDTRRLSVGFRPLPPDDIMESEDPEYRANRIRSFYKEYFDDNKPLEPMPPLPQQYAAGHHGGYGQGDAGYYDNYDQGHMGEAAYFDPASNAFVMPYAQPVARRAMTPPPSGQRFPGPRGPGPRGPPRGPPGGPRNPSLGGMSLPGGPGPRPDSSVSNRHAGPRPGSAASGAWGRPRAGSTMSGGRFGGPRKPMPPPAALPTLPTPSKLKDDSFALLNAMDFAPPESFADRARGRSQSPFGERKEYKVNVPVHDHLVNAFEELPALPSPHLLRKSSTFTALDFAAPRKFVDNDARSDAGSIRSNRSGMSQAQLSAIRGGAGRISRLPGDTIFTQEAMGNKLKPQWSMRD